MTLMGHESHEQAPGGCPADLPLHAARGRALAAALAGLGPVLMLVRDPPADRERGGCDQRLALACAHGTVVARADVDPIAGSLEELAVLDAGGTVHLRLVRLPESDWMGWDQVLERVGAWVEPRPAPGPPCATGRDATIRRAARRHPAWRAHPVRLHQTDEPARPLRVQPLAQCSWAALRVIEALREGASVQVASGA